MQTISAMEIKQRSCTGLTNWMKVHAGNVNNENQAEELHKLTAWMRVHEGNVSNENQAEELHTTHKLDESSCGQCQQWKSSRAIHDSQPRGEFMQAISAMERKQKSFT
jgi:NMD protein affecting ribosome stability and mRNA decay